jgi:hypothetical protein
MKKIPRIIGKILLLLFIVLVVLLGGIFIYNKIMLASEEALIEKPIGQYVEVDGHKMNIYTEGEGKHTLLFLSGSGTAAPVHALDGEAVGRPDYGGRAPAPRDRQAHDGALPRDIQEERRGCRCTLYGGATLHSVDDGRVRRADGG